MEKTIDKPYLDYTVQFWFSNQKEKMFSRMSTKENDQNDSRAYLLISDISK